MNQTPNIAWSGQEPAVQITSNSSVSGGWLPPLTLIVSRTSPMKILTGLLPFFCSVCFGAVAFLGAHNFVKGVGPVADLKRRVIRVTGGTLVVLMLILATAWLLSQK
jgi:hypothetical protein